MSSIGVVSDEMYDQGYTDEVGGFHIRGVGYSPNGRFCGECISSTCKNCVYFGDDTSSLPTEAREFITSRFSRRS